jgi:hypothetical protein
MLTRLCRTRAADGGAGQVVRHASTTGWCRGSRTWSCRPPRSPAVAGPVRGPHADAGRMRRSAHRAGHCPGAGRSAGSPACAEAPADPGRGRDLGGQAGNLGRTQAMISLTDMSDWCISKLTRWYEDWSHMPPSAELSPEEVSGQPAVSARRVSALAGDLAYRACSSCCPRPARDLAVRGRRTEFKQ